MLLANTNVYSQRSSVTGQKFKSNQNKHKKKPLNFINYIGLTGSVGLGNYMGDLCDGFKCIKPRPSFGIGAEYRLNESFMFRTEVNYLRFSGSDEGGKYETLRGLEFFSNNIDFNVNVVYDIFEFNKMYRRRHFISPFVSVGLGLVTVAPKVKYEGNTYKLRPLETEGVAYSPIAFAIPYSFGARLNVHPHNTLSFEICTRYTFTDYIDDISTIYDVNKQNLPNDDISKILADRRNEHGLKAKDLNNGSVRGGKFNDMYFTGTIRFTHTFQVTRQRYNINSNTSKFRLIKSIQKK